MTLDHVIISTRDLPTTKDFFIKVFDLKEKKRPKIIQDIPRHWLFSGDRPLVHLIGSYGNGFNQASEAIDHVGIRLEDYASFKKKLDRLKIPFSLMDIKELQERRIFFRTPGGSLLEAVFNEQIE